MAKSIMLQRIIDGRTDLVFDYLAAGHAASAKDERGRPLIAWCAYHGDVSAIGDFSIHPENHSTYDHGAGWSQMDPHSLGRPHVQDEDRTGAAGSGS